MMVSITSTAFNFEVLLQKLSGHVESKVKGENIKLNGKGHNAGDNSMSLLHNPRNRIVCNNVLSMLTKCSEIFGTSSHLSADKQRPKVKGRQVNTSVVKFEIRVQSSLFIIQCIEKFVDSSAYL